MIEIDAPSVAPPDAPRDRYIGVLAFLLIFALLGEGAAIFGGRIAGNKALLDVAVTLLLVAAAIAGVLAPRLVRPVEEPAEAPETSPDVASVESPDGAMAATDTPEAEDAGSVTTFEQSHAKTVEQLFKPMDERWAQRFANIGRWILERTRHVSATDLVRDAAAFVGIVASLIILSEPFGIGAITVTTAIVVGGLCFVGMAAAALAARYLGDVDPAVMPQGTALVRVARVAAWMLGAAAISVGLERLGQQALVRGIHLTITAINLAWCAGLLRARSRNVTGAPYPVDVGVISVLGARANIGAGILDAGQRQLGIDLRSTWALVVVRQSIEPLATGLFLVAWLSTALTVVGVQEQGLVERLGVSAKDPLAPGLHLHWPWPIDRVVRLPTLRAQSLEVGHEGQEAAGPENVLWAVEHAKNEFTLVLGNGRDLIVIDAAVHYRIVDPRAWHYHAQNPAVALTALAYRAVMRNTVNRTLSEALSENVTQVAERMRQMVQADADTLGLGVQVLGFTIGGMHPPVAVAAAYQNVVSAEIRKATAIVSAQEYRNRSIPTAEAASLLASNRARAAGADALGKAAGEAWSFRALEAQYRASPQDYMFRRRLESLEDALATRGFIIVDSRFLRDGGQLWINP